MKRQPLITLTRLVILILLIGAPINLRAQTATTAPASLSPIHLVGQLGGMSRAVAVQGNFVYVGVGPRLAILKLDTLAGPGHPLFVGQTAVLPGIVESVAVQGDYAYVAIKEGLHIIDVRDPTQPAVIGEWQPPEPPEIGVTRWVNAVAVSGAYAYLAASSSGLRILDISNPNAPAAAAVYDTQHANGIALANNYAYVADSGGLYIINVNLPSSPQLAAVFDSQVFDDVAVVGNYACVAAGRSGLRIVDVSISTAPVAAGVAWTAQGAAQRVAIAGTRAYVAVAAWGNEPGGLSVIDIATPSTPQETSFSTLPWPASALGVAVAGNYAYLAAENLGLRTFDVSAPVSPVESDVYQTLGTVVGVADAGDHVYVADLQGGLRSVDVRDPARPAVRGAYDTPNPWPRGVAVAGTHAYLVDGESLRIVDRSSPDNLIETSVYTTPGTATAVAVALNHAYVADTNAGLLILDVANPSNPSKVADFPTAGGAADGLAVANNNVYVADRWVGLRIINVANPIDPTQIGVVQPARAATRVALTEAYAYVAGEGFGVIDVSNPVAPFEVYSTLGAIGVAARGPYAYVVNDAALRILDMTVPAMPVEVAEIVTPGYAGEVTVDGKYIYVADGEGGLAIYQFPPSVTAVIPLTGGTLASPFDDVTYTFPPDAFSDPVVVTHTLRLPADAPPLDGKLGIGRFFDVTAVYSTTGQPAQPATAYTVTAGYTSADLGTVNPAILKLFWWDPDSAQWSQAGISSAVDTNAQQVVAQVEHFSLFAVLGVLQRVYLPLVLR
jgi:hypothetical protein